MASVLNPSAGPFNGRLQNDNNYNISSSVVALSNTSSFDFIQATPFPVTDKIDFTLILSPTGTNTASVTLQSSPDQSTWTTSPTFANPILKTGNASNSSSVTFKLTSDAKRYLRVSGSGATGDSYNLYANF